MAYRIDSIGKLMQPLETPEGFLMADAFVTRPGVFEYKLADGTVRRELRTREEVFAPSSLSTFARKPTCLGHPVDAKGDAIRITPENARTYATGASSEKINVDAEADMVRMTLTFFDGDHIQAIRDGVHEQSLGYDCDIVEEPGTDPEFGAYDAIQRNIVGNHVATVERGRAGRNVRLRADSAYQVVNDDDPSPHELTMKIKIRRKKTTQQRADARKNTLSKPAPPKSSKRTPTKRRDSDEMTDDEVADMEEEEVEMPMEEAIPKLIEAVLESIDGLNARFDALEGRLDAMIPNADEDDEPVDDEDDELVDDEDDDATGDEDDMTGDADYTEPPARADRRDSARGRRRRSSRQDAEAAQHNYMVARRKLDDLANALPSRKRVEGADDMTNTELARAVVKAHLGDRMRNDSEAYVMAIVDELSSARKLSRSSHKATGRSHVKATASASSQRTDSERDARQRFADRMHGKTKT